MKTLLFCPQLWPLFCCSGRDAPSGTLAVVVQVMEEVAIAAEAMDADPGVRAIIITGEGSKAFAAGADIKEMSTLSYSEVNILCWARAFDYQKLLTLDSTGHDKTLHCACSLSVRGSVLSQCLHSAATCLKSDSLFPPCGREDCATWQAWEDILLACLLQSRCAWCMQHQQRS